MIQALVYAAQVETGGCAEAEGDCSAGVVSIVIPGYAERWGYELDKYQVYARSTRT